MGAILAFVIGNCISQECFLPTFKVEQGRYNHASPIFLARPMTHMIVDCRSGFVGCAPDQNEGISDGATINSNTNGPRGVCAIKSLNAPKKRKKKTKKKTNPTQPTRRVHCTHKRMQWKHYLKLRHVRFNSIRCLALSRNFDCKNKNVFINKTK